MEIDTKRWKMRPSIALNRAALDGELGNLARNQLIEVVYKPLQFAGCYLILP
jgi:hypothetical protein